MTREYTPFTSENLQFIRTAGENNDEQGVAYTIDGIGVIDFSVGEILDMLLVVRDGRRNVSDQG